MRRLGRPLAWAGGVSSVTLLGKADLSSWGRLEELLDAGPALLAGIGQGPDEAGDPGMQLGGREQGLPGLDRLARGAERGGVTGRSPVRYS